MNIRHSSKLEEKTDLNILFWEKKKNIWIGLFLLDLTFERRTQKEEIFLKGANDITSDGSLLLPISSGHWLRFLKVEKTGFYQSIMPPLCRNFWQYILKKCL